MHYPPGLQGRLPEGAAFFAIKARYIVPLCGPARGPELFQPPKMLENACLVIRDGFVEDITLTPRCPVIDLGDVALLPPLVNAHTHLQFSWLTGATEWGHGFVAWLQSLIPFVLQNIGRNFGTKPQLLALEQAASTLAGAIIGDVGASLPGALSHVQAAAQKYGIKAIHFCEWFGFEECDSPWPPRCRAELSARPELQKVVSPAGHALYSTSMATLAKVHRWCQKYNRIFSLHLAESAEETEMLLHGTGSLAELYKGTVLPDNWTPPGLRPMEYALRSGILGRGTLAVHGVQLNGQEIFTLAETGTALCLCPRSNYNLGIGLPNVGAILSSGILCCLGTDGLTSNTDLDVQKEAHFLQDKFDIPLFALWRMATVNGASALGIYAALAKGQEARFSIWPL